MMAFDGQFSNSLFPTYQCQVSYNLILTWRISCSCRPVLGVMASFFIYNMSCYGHSLNVLQIKKENEYDGITIR